MARAAGEGEEQGKPEAASSAPLIARAKAGDRGAFDQLLTPCRVRLEALIRLRLGRKLRLRVDEDDVFQETLLKGYRSFEGFAWQGEGSFFRWLAVIAENVIHDLARHHLLSAKAAVDREVPLASPLHGKGGQSGELGELLADSVVSPSRGMRRDERLERLERALDSLSPEYREVLVLTRIQGVPVAEAAKRMGRSRGAVSMLILRALRELREAFGPTDSLRLPERSLDPEADQTAVDPEN